MSEVIYAIVFSGGIIDGHQPISVKAHMAKMLKADADKMATLFSGKQVVLKRTPDKEQAIKIGTALKKIGADVKVKAVKAKAPAPAPGPAPAARATADTSAQKAPVAAPRADAGTSLSLAPNEGNIVEPAPAPEPPALDLSGLSLAENNDQPLAPPRQVEAPAIDLSEYTISEMDGSPLVEPSPSAPPVVEAPDFGLDEPGAVLPTLKEEKEIVSPDISSLSLAEPGSDLLDETDRKQAPPPRAPDTSSLQLVSVFDA